MGLVFIFLYSLQIKYQTAIPSMLMDELAGLVLTVCIVVFILWVKNYVIVRVGRTRILFDGSCINICVQLSKKVV